MVKHQAMAMVPGAWPQEGNGLTPFLRTKEPVGGGLTDQERHSTHCYKEEPCGASRGERGGDSNRGSLSRAEPARGGVPACVRLSGAGAAQREVRAGVCSIIIVIHRRFDLLFSNLRSGFFPEKCAKAFPSVRPPPPPSFPRAPGDAYIGPTAPTVGRSPPSAAACPSHRYPRCIPRRRRRRHPRVRFLAPH